MNSLLDLAYFHRPGKPIKVKDAKQITSPDAQFWRGMLVAIPLSLAIWGLLILVMVAWG